MAAWMSGMLHEHVYQSMRVCLSDGAVTVSALHDKHLNQPTMDDSLDEKHET